MDERAVSDVFAAAEPQYDAARRIGSAGVEQGAVAGGSQPEADAEGVLTGIDRFSRGDVLVAVEVECVADTFGNGRGINIVAREEVVTIGSGQRRDVGDLDGAR